MRLPSSQAAVQNFTYRNGRCPARCYMEDILARLEQKFWGDPFPGPSSYR